MLRSDNSAARICLTAWFAVITILAVSTFFSDTFPYQAAWFKLIWILMGVGVTVTVIKTGMWRHTGSLLIHSSIIILIIGGLLTAGWGKSGRLMLPPGSVEVRSWIDDADGTPRLLPVPMSLDSFVISHYTGLDIPSDYISHITLADGRHEKISVNHPLTIGSYRFYQASYDGSGATLIAVSHDPAGGMIVCYTGFLLLISGSLILLTDPHGRFRQLLSPHWRPATLILIAGVLTTLFFWFNSSYGSGEPVRPVLASRWLGIHVGLIITSYAIFCFTFLISIVGALRPSEQYRSITLLLLYPAVGMLAAGIAAGSVWAGEAWGRFWAWDPKETWALITLMVYIIPLHIRMRPRRLAIFMLLTFLSVIMTYIGVRYLPTIHAYR